MPVVKKERILKKDFHAPVPGILGVTAEDIKKFTEEEVKKGAPTLPSGKKESIVKKI